MKHNSGQRSATPPVVMFLDSAQALPPRKGGAFIVEG